MKVVTLKVNFVLSPLFQSSFSSRDLDQIKSSGLFSLPDNDFKTRKSLIFQVMWLWIIIQLLNFNTDLSIYPNCVAKSIWWGNDTVEA